MSRRSSVAGQPGIGKTSLVQEIYQPITRQRGYFVAGKFDQLQQNVPFSALVTALQDLVQQLLTEGEEEIAAWREAIHAAVHPNGQLIVDVVPALELIIGPQPRVPELEALEAQNRFNLVFQNFVQVFCKKSHPLVLFLDDMQWADSASLNLITLIVSARATESLLLVLTYRDNEVAANHPFMLAIKEQAKQGVPVHSIELEPLGVPRGRRVRRRRAAPGRRDRDAARGDHSAEDGRQPVLHAPVPPGAVRRAAHHLRRASEARSATTSAAVKSAAITENVAELLATKLAAACPRARATTLRVAAVIGGRFELRLARERAAAVGGRRRTTSLRPAIEAGSIVPLTGLESVDCGRAAVAARLRAVRVPCTTACSRPLMRRCPRRERPALHLAIGRAWLAMAPAARAREPPVRHRRALESRAAR